MSIIIVLFHSVLKEEKWQNKCNDLYQYKKTQKGADPANHSHSEHLRVQMAPIISAKTHGMDNSQPPMKHLLFSQAPPCLTVHNSVITADHHKLRRSR
jgi:hypothetical protein